MKRNILLQMVTLLIVSLAALSLGVTPARAAGPLCFVDDSAVGTNDGTSWADAYTSLQSALADTGCSEIWVAAGTYWPGASGARSATFQLKNSVAIYGGFAGSENSRDDRDWTANPTILSGDLDSSGTINNNDAYHVVNGSGVDATAVLDGFTITGGYANGAYPAERGGGMYINGGSPTLAHLIFTANTASFGGGMYIQSSSPTLTAVTFSSNTATGSGGGLFNNTFSQPVLTDVLFSNNTASSNGGGMETESSSSPILTNVTFVGNHSTGAAGGGAFNDTSSSPQWVNVRFIGNSAATWGGGMFSRTGSYSLTNGLFSGNTAQRGGGMANWNISPTLVNVTFSHNTATIEGGAMHNSNTSTPALNNLILWGNSDPSGAQIYNSTSTPTIAYSDIQGSGGSGGGWNASLGTDLGGNIDADPLFLDADGADNLYGTLDDNLRLPSGSPAVNTGNSTALPADLADLDGDGDTGETLPLDLDLSRRVSGTSVDMGAYEFEFIWYVDDNGAAGNGCTSWADACPDLQTALAKPGISEIWVAAGTYRPGASGARTATFQLKNGVEIYGGFAGTESSRDARDWALNVTILSGDLDSSGSLTSNDAYHVVTGSSVDASAVLDGFTITGGYANGTYPSERGGGMYIDIGSPTLAYLTFTASTASFGGGMYIQGSNPTLTAVTFSGNAATGSGGGMFNNTNSQPVLTDVLFTNNTASGNGGGMDNESSSHPILTNVTFNGNTSTNAAGGGMFNDTGSTLTLNNVSFTNNSAATFGGGMYHRSGAYTFNSGSFSGNTAQWGGGMVNNNNTSLLRNVTFSNNTALAAGGGMYNYDGGNPSLVNVSFSGNTALNGGGMYNTSSNPTLINATLSSNTASSNGGGIYNTASSPTLVDVALLLNTAVNFGGGIENTNGSSPTLVNVSIAHNSAGRFGGGLDNYISSSPVMTNTIIWGNTASTGAQVYNSTSSTPSYAYSDIQGAYASGAWDNDLGIDGGGNLDADPLFGGQSAYPPFGSPVLDVADSTALPPDTYDLDSDGNTSEPLPLDLDGGERVWGAGLDLGATEYRLWYVDGDAAPGNGCTSWADACPDLQTALVLPPGEIWVAEGVYQPGASGVVTATFRLRNGQALYGGFAGGEMVREERDWVTHAITLTGDLDGSGSFTASDAYHVVTTRSTDRSAVLDGFTITGGYAPYVSGCNLISVDGICQGGGIINWYGSPTLTNLVVRNNQAYVGGGVYSRYGSPRLANILFSGNTAAGGSGTYGAGMFSSAGSPVLTEVVFSGNSGASNGGGLYGYGVTLTEVTFIGNSAIGGGGMCGSGTLTQVTFESNTATNRGGGMVSFSDSHLTDITFRSNTAGIGGGGGFYLYTGRNIRLTNVTFSGNSTSGNGGGVYNYHSLGPIIFTNVTFSGNSTGGSGGGVYNDNSPGPIIFTNVTFSGNAATHGGGMYHSGDSSNPGSVALTNVTFSHNIASSTGGGIRLAANAILHLNNTILWGNNAPSGPQINLGTPITATVASSDIQGSGGSGAGWDPTVGADWGGNIDADPLFADADGADDLYGTLDDDLRLLYPSPALDAGDNAAVLPDTLDLDGDGDTSEPLPYDLDGSPRFLDTSLPDTGSGAAPIVDMGAYETANALPTLSAIAGQSTPEDTPTAPITFTIGDLELTPISLTLSAASSDLGLLPLSGIALSGAGITRTVILTPAADLHGSAVITLTVSDGIDTASAAFILTVTPVNDAPNLSNLSDQITGEDTPTSAIPVTVGDIDTPPEALTLSAASSNPDLTPVASIAFGGAGADRTVTITPTADLNGTAVITITVSDGSLSASDHFTLTVTPVNDAPLITPIADQAVNEGQPLSLTLTASDIDLPGDVLTFTLEAGAPDGANISAGGGFTWMPDESQGPGAYPISVRVTDNGTPALYATAAFTVTVAEVNEAPLLEAIPGQTVDEGTLLTFNASASDPDLPANTLTYTLEAGAPDGASINPANGLFTWTPEESQGPGVYTLTVRVIDDGAPTLFDTTTFTVCIAEVNQAPVAVDDMYTVVEDTSLTVPAPGLLDNDGDPDLPANTLSVALAIPPATGTLDLHPDGSFTYTPTLNANNTVIFSYRLIDGQGGEDYTYVTLHITPVNDVPEVDAGEDVNTFEGDVVQFNGIYSDPGLRNLQAVTITWDFGDGATLTGTLAPTHTYADDGVYTVTLTVDDGEGGVGVDTLLVTVENAAPALEPIADQSILAGEVLTLTAVYTDPGVLDTHRATIVWGDGYTDTIDLDAGLTGFDFAHAFDAAGDYTVTITLTDDDGGQNAITFQVIVAPSGYKIFLPTLVRK